MWPHATAIRNASVDAACGQTYQDAEFDVGSARDHRHATRRMTRSTAKYAAVSYISSIAVSRLDLHQSEPAADAAC